MGHAWPALMAPQDTEPILQSQIYRWKRSHPSWCQKSQASSSPILTVCICHLMEYGLWLPIMHSWGFGCLALQGSCKDPISSFHLPQCFAEGILFPLWGVIHEMMFQRQVTVIMPFQIPACQRENYLRNLKTYLKWEISAAVLVQLGCGLLFFQC